MSTTAPHPTYIILYFINISTPHNKIIKPLINIITRGLIRDDTNGIFGRVSDEVTKLVTWSRTTLLRPPNNSGGNSSHGAEPHFCDRRIIPENVRPLRPKRSATSRKMILNHFVSWIIASHLQVVHYILLSQNYRSLFRCYFELGSLPFAVTLRKIRSAESNCTTSTK